MHKLSKLKNGLNLITTPIKGTKSVTLMALFPVGSRFETKDISGASHFVEHMIFKGTTKRPTYLEISQELDSVGADYNAFTNKDYTGYYIKINSAKQKMAFDLLSDMLFNSKFDKSEVKKEKGVITEELKMYDDNPTMAIDNLFENLFFGDHPLGWDIGGSKKTVKNMSREQLYNYYKKYYRPDNMVLAIAGDINKKNLKNNLKCFSGSFGNKDSLKKIKSYKKFVNKNKKLTKSQRVSVKNKRTDQAHIIMGFPGIGHNDKRKYVLGVLLSVLSGGMSSRLFVEVREKRGLAYMIRAGASPYDDTGVVEIQAGLDPVRLPEAITVIKDELNKISTELVGKKELSDAKNNMFGKLALALEDSSNQADWFAKSFWFAKEIKTYNKVVAEIKKVTDKQVKDLANKIFEMDQLRLAAIGPLEKSKVLKML